MDSQIYGASLVFLIYNPNFIIASGKLFGEFARSFMTSTTNKLVCSVNGRVVPVIMSKVEDDLNLGLAS